MVPHPFPSRKLTQVANLATVFQERNLWREVLKLNVSHPLDLPSTLPEWWEVEVSWESRRKLHLYSTEEEAFDYARKRVQGFVKVRESNKKYRPLVVQWEDCPFCLHRALLGVDLLGAPVWD